MDEWLRAVAVLPTDVQVALHAVPSAVRENTQEIRFRANTPLLLTGRAQSYPLSGKIYSAADLHRLFTHLCAYSVYSHQEEIRHGYIATANGCRVGIAGHAVIENGQVVSMRDIRAICLRVAREHRGCAAQLLSRLYRNGRLQSVLLCGGPASGKTTLLRDVIRAVSAERQLAVVDERGELTATFGDVCPFDVLSGYTKAQGVEQALRTLSPEGIVFDELGGERDVAAITRCVHSGVATLGSIHAEDVAALRQRKEVFSLVQAGAWDWIAVMRGRQSPGEIGALFTAQEVAG